jgi:hypothetical protein
MSSPRQERFLDAYRQRPEVARAARHAGVHRGTIYRWQADPAFAKALQAATDDFFRTHRQRVLGEEAARAEWRRERERARRSMRCHNLSLARAAKCRKGR